MGLYISGVVFLLLSLGSWTLHSNAYGEYFLVKEANNWTGAQAYCRAHYTDLAVIGNSGDLERLKNATVVSGSADIWFGLKKVVEERWMWSVGGGQVPYSNWTIVNISQYCGGMRPDGGWVSADCGDVHPFVCQTGSGNISYSFDQVTWLEAQKCCRLNSSDLASARSMSENLSLQTLIKASDPSVPLVWTGLFKDTWTWSDQSPNSFRNWESDQQNNDGLCALYDSGTLKWFDRSCKNSYYFCCYTGRPTEKRMERVKIELNSKTLNFSAIHPAVTEEILNQIKNIHGGQMKWVVQSDGKIFHKKEKKKKDERVCD